MRGFVPDNAWLYPVANQVFGLVASAMLLLARIMSFHGMSQGSTSSFVWRQSSGHGRRVWVVRTGESLDTR